MTLYAEVALNAALATTLTYVVPEEWEGRIQPGQLVTAPLREGRVYAVVLALQAHTPVPDPRPLGEPVDVEPVLGPVQIALARWISARTRAALMDCVRLMLPPGLARRADVLVERVVPAPQIGRRLTVAQQRVLEALDARGPLRGRQIARILGDEGDWRNVTAQLVKRGLIRKQMILAPPGVRPKQARVVQLSASPAEIEDAWTHDLSGLPRAALYRAILDLLLDEDTALEAAWVYAQTGCTRDHLNRLELLGLVTFAEEEVWRDPLEGQFFVPSAPLALTRDQSNAVERIVETVRSGAARARATVPVALNPAEGAVFLLHGVTGSGKTEVYLQATAEAVRLGRTALILVPEIALTPQTIRRFAARFPAQVAVVHSLLSQGERYDTWRRIRAGDLRVIVGTRSALFAPVRELGLIVLDEEHDASYKQSPEMQGAAFHLPAYHAREVALALGQLTGAPVVLGSATPELGTYYHAARGTYQLLSLPQRVLGHEKRLDDLAQRYRVPTMRYRPLVDEPAVAARFIELPPVTIVDLRAELKSGNRHIFSRVLQGALDGAIGRGEQVILFLNRRGRATFILCRDCGHVLQCERCDTPLTYHRATAVSAREVPRLVCHHCNFHSTPPAACPKCKGVRIRYFGLGTEQVEEAVQSLYPNARTLRWDRDTVRTPEAHGVLLQQFISGQAQVLVGTQMIAKGLDLPRVTVVGVISADTALFLPDYRAGERTFQLLTQVAGRAGRGLLSGQVVIQTYNPEHYAIQAAAGHDFAGFYQQELAYRRAHFYPPFRRLARLLYRDADNGRAEASAQAVAGQLRRVIQKYALGLSDLLGPAPCFFTRIDAIYRWQILVRSPDPLNVLQHVDLPEGWSVDIDPASTL